MLSSALPSRRAHHFPGMQAAGAHLDLRDLAVDNDARHLKIRLPGLRLGDQPLDERAQLLGFRLGCLDRATLDQRLGQTPHQRELLLDGAAKLSANLTVTHPYTSSSSSAPTVATLRFGGVP